MSRNWPLPERFRIRLSMQSDWHVGSGMGRPGNIDRLIARDADGLPFVPAKTLKGIWRDACERLCRGLDDGRLGEWSRLVDRLFGSQPALADQDATGRHMNPANAPLESAVQIRSALISSPLREQLVRADVRLRQALTFVKPGVKIDRRSGSAQTDFLRFEEMGRRGTVLEAECRLMVDDSVRELASALLIASAKLVERLGGKRRRGAGRCRLEILDADTEKAIQWLSDHEQAPNWSPAKHNDTLSDTRHVAQQADPWICVPLVLQLQGPLAVLYRTTGNVVETLDFLPGSYLLSHVTRMLPPLRAGVAAGNVVLLPAYPEVDGERGQPVPLAWFAPKGLEKPLQGENRERVVNRLLQAEPADGTQLKQMREGYISTRPTTDYKPPIIVRTHNTVEDQSQRPTEKVGGVYTYEAIAPRDKDQPVVLRSELRIRKSLADQLEVNWLEKLNGEVSLGRSKKDDYGAVRLEVGSPSEWRSQTQAESQELFVWLVSDTLLRNQRLRPEPTAACLGAELSRWLGVTLTPRHSSDGRLDELVRLRRLDTWHVGWGLPRPSLVALQAGSCLVFQVEGMIDPATLARLEASGIGERTAEGYGQVRFNHPLLTQAPKDWPASNSKDSNSTKQVGSQRTQAMDETSHSFARRIETECWKQEIRRACLKFAAYANKRTELLGWEAEGEQSKPPMSQLGGLRGQLMVMQKAEQRQQVIDWLDHLANNKRRAEKWPSISKVKDFIQSDTRIWEIIKTDDWPTLTANAQVELRRELWALAVRTFFDACIRAHKRDLEKQQNREEAARGA
uniref:CRISPR type III-associated protein domain-containing protein n=1 Tax=Schlesneria paludicola TaxID=360056 RepID=A0A7C4QPM7_9PLAN